MTFPNDAAFCTAYDDLPLWSAPFGLALLERVRLRGVKAALDVGCGTGFPLIELADRLGAQVPVTGVDPWDAALARVRMKLRERRVANVTFVLGSVQRLPFPDGSFDLIVSNNGLNNVPDAAGAVAEIRRVARAGAQVVMTVNLPDSMRELYDAFDLLLDEKGLQAARVRMREHIAAKREPVQIWTRRFEKAGFTIVQAQIGSFRFRFADAEAIFAHSFIRAAFLPPWIEVLAGEAEPQGFFRELARRMDERSREADAVILTIPWLCLEARG
ncbi:MAG TPA: class I SAM-dependent methyltransferase [Myxococcales bacterium]